MIVSIAIAIHLTLSPLLGVHGILVQVYNAKLYAYSYIYSVVAAIPADIQS